MKRYVPIIIGIVALCALLYLANSGGPKDTEMKTEETPQVSLTSFSGKVTRTFEGDHTLEYTLDLPETATATLEKDGALVKVSENDQPVLAMYVSYEGGRGYTPEDYISNVIVPSVKAVNTAGVVTLGKYEWTVVESEWTEWHVAKTEDSQWLLVVENKKADKEKADAIIESIFTK
jgi:hypothetical protein